MGPEGLRQTRVLGEGGRFGNVRFIAGDFHGDGQTDLVAWWCTDLAGGDAEMVVYRLDRKGVASRRVVARGPASELWPDDGQFVAGDLDADGRDEVWFATRAGNLWRFDQAHAPAHARIARFSKKLGPIAIGPDFYQRDRERLYLASDKTVYNLEGGDYRPAPAPAPLPSDVARRPANPNRPAAG